MNEPIIHAPDGLVPASLCDGGDLDCGSGLLLIIRKAMNEVADGGVLEIRSTEISVREDLPAWCRMTKNPYLGWRAGANTNRYFVRRGGAMADQSLEQARNYQWQTRVRGVAGGKAKVFARNHSFEVGQPASFDVQDEAPSAVEYVLGALGACLVNGFRIHASRRGIQIEEIEISLSGKLDNILVFLGVDSEGHPGLSAIQATLYVQAEANPEVLESLWDETCAKSPALNTLARTVAVNAQLRMV